MRWLREGPQGCEGFWSHAMKGAVAETCFSWRGNIQEGSLHISDFWLRVAPGGRIRIRLAWQKEDISSKVEPCGSLLQVPNARIALAICSPLATISLSFKIQPKFPQFLEITVPFPASLVSSSLHIRLLEKYLMSTYFYWAESDHDVERQICPAPYLGFSKWNAPSHLDKRKLGIPATGFCKTLECLLGWE